MNKPLKLKQSRIFAPAVVLFLVLILFRPPFLNAQDDRGERLQEQVKSLDDRIDVRKERTESRAVTSPAFQAVRKAKKKKAQALQKVAAAERAESRTKKQFTQREAVARADKFAGEAGGRVNTSKKQQSERIRRARKELEAADAELREAKERLDAQ